MQKKLRNLALIFASALLIFTGISCSFEDDKDDKLSPSFEVGSTVKVGGLDYTVVSNSFNESNETTRSVSSGIFASLVAFKRTKEFAEKSFGKNILLVRVAGKVTVPQGQKEIYIDAYNAVVPKKIPEGFKETDFFNYNSLSDDTKHLYYADTYIVLDRADINSQVGNIKAQWNSAYIGTFIDSDGTEKTFSEVLKNFSPNIIRNTVPTEFKTYKTDNYFLYNAQTNSDGNVIKEQYPVPDCGYYSKKNGQSPKPAATIHNYFDDEGEWTEADICLCPIYGSENAYSGAALIVKKSGDEYMYLIRGKGGRVNETKKRFSFSEDGTFKADAINLEDLKDLITYSADVTHYDSEDFPYTSEIRTAFPVSFVKRKDGSVDFGKEVYDFAKKWRDVILENNSDASPYVE